MARPQDEITRLLIVDDHDLFRTGLRTLLEEEGFEVRDAADGSAAVALGRSIEPDVVVMDMHMPEMSGIEATRLMLQARPETVVLMLTVAGDDDQVLDAVRAGTSAYLLRDATWRRSWPASARRQPGTPRSRRVSRARWWPPSEARPAPRNHRRRSSRFASTRCSICWPLAWTTRRSAGSCR